MICVINYEAMIARTMASECNECGVIGTGAKKCILQKTDHCGLGSLLINEQPPRRHTNRVGEQCVQRHSVKPGGGQFTDTRVLMPIDSNKDRPECHYAPSARSIV